MAFLTLGLNSYYLASPIPLIISYLLFPDNLKISQIFTHVSYSFSNQFKGLNVSHLQYRSNSLVTLSLVFRTY